MTHVRRFRIALLGLALGGCATPPWASVPRSGAAALEERKPRVVVTTDPELDDSNSLITRYRRVVVMVTPSGASKAPRRSPAATATPLDRPRQR